MYKSILLALIITIFAGCGQPDTPQRPVWFTSPPKDFDKYYSVGRAVNAQKAQNIATIALREKLNSDLDNSFKVKNHKLSLKQHNRLSTILKLNEIRTKTISLRTLKVEKIAFFEGDKYVLVSIAKKDLFDSVCKISNKKLQTLHTKYKNIKNAVAIERFATIQEILLEYEKTASDLQFKQNILSTYNPDDEFEFLNTLDSNYKKLKEDISVYILTDGNSTPFYKSVKEAILSADLSISKKPKSDDSIKLLISSKTTNGDEYTFKKAKTLIKFTTYNTKREKIKFKQHTFTGKSTKTHKEAKAQSTLHLKSKLDKEGIFKFLGIL